MTKDEINKEYGQAAGALGERVYRFFVPFLEAHQILCRMMVLNQEAWKLQEAEKKTESSAEQTPAGLELAEGGIGSIK